MVEAITKLKLPRLTVDVDGTVECTGAKVQWAFRARVVQGALAGLEELGWIRPEAVRGGTAGGPPCGSISTRGLARSPPGGPAEAVFPICLYCSRGVCRSWTGHDHQA